MDNNIFDVFYFIILILKEIFFLFSKYPYFYLIDEKPFLYFSLKPENGSQEKPENGSQENPENGSQENPENDFQLTPKIDQAFDILHESTDLVLLMIFLISILFISRKLEENP
jgi:hypothetical protein